MVISSSSPSFFPPNPQEVALGQADNVVKLTDLPDDVLTQIVGLATDDGLDLKVLRRIDAVSPELRSAATPHFKEYMAEINFLTFITNKHLKNAQQDDRYTRDLSEYVDRTKTILKSRPQWMPRDSEGVHISSGIALHDLHLMLRGDDQSLSAKTKCFPDLARIAEIPEFTNDEIKKVTTKKADHVSHLYGQLNHEVGKERCRHLINYLPQFRGIALEQARVESKRDFQQSLREKPLYLQGVFHLSHGVLKAFNAIIPNRVTNPVTAGVLGFAITAAVLHEFVLSDELKLARALLLGGSSAGLAALTVVLRKDPAAPLFW